MMHLGGGDGNCFRKQMAASPESAKVDTEADIALAWSGQRVDRLVATDGLQHADDVDQLMVMSTHKSNMLSLSLPHRHQHTFQLTMLLQDGSAFGSSCMELGSQGR